MTTVSIAHIEIDEKGKARVAGSRSKVTQIVQDTRNGLSPEQIHQSYPHLSLSQIHAALSYYYDHKAALDAEIERGYREVEALRAKAGPSPVVARLRAEGKLK